MHITKRQSLIIAVGSIIGFFLVGFLFLQNNQKRIALSGSTSPTTTLTQPNTGAPSTDQPSQPPIALTAPSSAGDNPTGSSMFTMKDFHRSEVKDGRTVWEINGSKGQYYPQTNSAMVFDAEVSLYNKNGQKSELSAKQAEVFLNGAMLDRAHAKQNVRVINNGDTILTTDEALYDRAKGTLSTVGAVKITNPKMEITADKLDGNMDSQVFTLSGDVVTVVNPR